jgi:hypothetical protein
VLFRDPLNPTFPALDQPITFPVRSVIETIVLLKVARIWATPAETFLLPFALTIFGFSASPPSRERLTLAPSGAPSFLVLGLVGRIALVGSPAGAGAGVAGAGVTGAGASVETAGGAADAGSSLGAGVGVVVSFGIRCSRGLDLTCLGVLVALHADRLSGAFAGPGVRRSPLTTDWKPADMACSSIASNRLQAFQVSLYIAPQITFDQESAGIDGMNDFTQLFRRQIFCTHVRVDVRLLKDFFSGFRPDAVNVRQRSFDPLISGYINSK